MLSEAEEWTVCKFLEHLSELKKIIFIIVAEWTLE